MRSKAGSWLSIAAILCVAASAQAEETLELLPTIIHLHSSLSSGSNSLDALVEQASREGVGAILLTENLLLRFEYGLFPLRNLVRKQIEYPSVLTYGIDRYLDLVQQAGQRHPEVILIPGVEVAPHYLWTGSAFTKDLTMYNGQKNILVVGLERPEDYRGLPVIGNGVNSRFRWESLLLLSPGILVALGVWRLKRKRIRRHRFGGMTLAEQRTAWGPGLVLIGLGFLFLANNFPFIVSQFDQYHDPGLRPYQELIDYAALKGAVSFWSYPEAQDFSQNSFGGLGIVTIKTDPYLGDLLKTSGYTGFGAVYQQNVTALDPGGGWDQLLLEYTAGRREYPVWGIGELGYHGSEKRLTDVQTFVWVRQRSRQGVLEAIRRGRMFAVQRPHDYTLLLRDFSLSQEGGKRAAISGEELRIAGQDPLLVRIKVEASDGSHRPLRIDLIRSGALIRHFEGETPFQVVYRDTPPSGSGKIFYRLKITSPHLLASNPIFAQRLGDA
ncbi:MAG: hypothetical protein KGL32_10635 [candidate division NC10 bacterium]|nr:hypothetical protein [candidate division NC10 bacterium]